MEECLMKIIYSWWHCDKSFLLEETSKATRAWVLLMYRDFAAMANAIFAEVSSYGRKWIKLIKKNQNYTLFWLELFSEKGSYGCKNMEARGIKQCLISPRFLPGGFLSSI